MRLNQTFPNAHSNMDVQDEQDGILNILTIHVQFSCNAALRPRFASTPVRISSPIKK
jgi:hypothetical protein